MASVSAQTSEKAKNFMKIMTTMMEIIEEVAPLIPEGKYIDLMKNIKKAYDIQNEEEEEEYIEGQAEEPQPQPQTNRYTLTQAINEIVALDPVFQQIQRQSKAKVMKDRQVLTKAQKLKAGWSVCPKCDSVVLDLREHQKYTYKCSDIYDAKHLTKSTGELDNTSYVETIIKINKVQLERKHKN